MLYTEQLHKINSSRGLGAKTEQIIKVPNFKLLFHQKVGIKYIKIIGTIWNKKLYYLYCSALFAQRKCHWKYWDFCLKKNEVLLSKWKVVQKGFKEIL